MNVVGLDLSLTSTGLVAIDDDDPISGFGFELYNIKSKGTKKDTFPQRRDRIFGIANQVVDWIKDARTDLVVIEAPSYGSQYGSAHDRSGLWWAVVGPLLHDNQAVAMVSPQGRAKYGTGKGNSKKDVVFAFVIHTYTDLCGQRIANDDIGDAILLAAMGARHLGHPVEPFELGEANLAAMEGVLWPAVV